MSAAHLETMDLSAPSSMPAATGALDLSHSMDPNSLTGIEARPALEYQVSLVTSMTCPSCGRLSVRIEAHMTQMPHGVAIAQVCVCPNGHAWPWIQVSLDDE